MNAHNPFDANKDWSNPYCQNSSNDPMVDALLGNAYHVVRTVYCNLGNLKLLYDFLNQYGMVLGVQSEAELKALTTKAKYARIYGLSRAGDRQVTDYLYVEGDRTGIIPNDPEATGSWITVATSGSNGGGTSSSEGAYIPWVYANGSATGGETSINVPDGTVGVPFIIVNGDMQYVGRGFEFNVDSLSVTLAQPLEEGDEVVFLLTGVPAVPDNPNVNDWVQINWLYNNGAAVGGEQVIAIPYTFQSVPAVYKNGLRLYKGLVTESYTADPDNQRILLTEPLSTNDRLIVQIGGEAQVLEASDHTLQEVARAANVKDSEVILSTDTVQLLNDKKVIYSISEQKAYGLPALPSNIYINSVSNGQLTYSPGNTTVDLVPVPNSGIDVVNALRADLVSEDLEQGDNLLTVKQPFTGSVVRTQHSKNTDVVSVKDFGAVGDGATDDSDSFIAAINSSAKKIVIPDGNYIISKAIPLKGNLEITGGVNSVLKLKDNVAPKPGAIFDKSDAAIIENVKLSGFTIDLNRLNNWTFGAPDENGNETQGDHTLGIGVRSINNLVLEGLTVKNSRRDGIWVVNCQNFMVVNCHVYDCCNTGLSIRNDIDAPNGLKNGLIEGNIAHGCTVGIHGIFAISNCTYHGNVCYNNKDANRFLHNYLGVYPNVYPNIGGYNTPSDPAYKTFANPGDGAGIEFTTSPMDPVTKPANRQIAVSGNSCSDNMHGIRAEGASKFLAITGNSCNDNERHGVYILATDPASVTGNSLVGNGVSGVCIERPTNSDASQVGTVPPDPSGFSISGNLISASGLHGIMLTSVSYSSITGNSLSDNNKTGNATGGAIGIYTTDGVPNVKNTFSSNMFRGGSVSPCVFYSSDGQFNSNVINSNSITSFDSISNDADIFNKNVIRDNSGYNSEASGVIALPSGATTVHVSPAIDFKLTAGRVQVTPANDVVGRWWIGNPSQTGFDIFVTPAQDSELLFYWRCE